jgi:hypothetical protein
MEGDEMTLDRAEVRRCFERGVGWVLTNAERLSPDARVAALAGLLLADPAQAEEAGSRLRGRREVRLSAAGKLLDLLTLGMVGRRLRERRRRANAFFALIERAPGPCARPDLDSFQHVPDPLPARLEELHGIDGARSNAALTQASHGRFEAPVLAWMHRDDRWGYDLAHQLLAWVVCLKAGHRPDEARATAGRLAWRLFHEVRLSPLPVHYDLVAERIAFLALAGFPLERLADGFRLILAAQDREDGGWWFTRDPADQAAMLEQAHLGASPLAKPAKPWRDQPDAEAVRRRLEGIHRGHATGLSLWALGLWLAGAPEDATL